MNPHYGRSTHRGNRPGLGLCGGLLLATGVLAPAPAAGEQGPVLPRLGEHAHLGVATCAGSTCHGAAAPVEGSAVLRNEYLTWHRRDAHAEAFDVLRSERSREIAGRLGLGPPTEAGTCLDCHADHVPPSRRGDKFQLSDGVGCEACHGGAEEWIRTHASGEVTHADNVARGLYPTDRPSARTRLCMSCHYSHPESPMTHRIMGAGHPPLLFEADTFTRIQPPHHRVDADYRARKTAASAAATWAVGQAVGARLKAAHVRDDLARGGLFPELYYFDCRGCHHGLGDRQWIARPIVARPPGSVRLEDATFRMLGYVLAELEPGLARDWRSRVKALHRAEDRGLGAATAAADALAELAREAERRIAAATLDAAAVRAIAARITAAGESTGYADRGWCDQAAMALAALVDTLDSQGALVGAARERARERLDELFDALAEPYGHSPWRAREALRAFGRTL